MIRMGKVYQHDKTSAFKQRESVKGKNGKGVLSEPQLPTQDDVCLLGLPFEQLHVIKTTIYKPDIGVLARYLGALVTVAHETGNFIVWVGVYYRIESIAANVSCRPGTVGQT